MILEVLGAMRVVKFFSYELPFLKRKCNNCGLLSRGEEFNTDTPPALSEGVRDIRVNELKGIRAIRLCNSLKYVLCLFKAVMRQTHDLYSIAMAFSIPVLAASLSFVAYTSLSSNFDVAVIFASFSLFQLLRQPLMFLPRGLSAIADTHSALTRLEKLFHAEVKREEEGLHIDFALKEAIRADKVTFEWEESVALDMTVPEGSELNKKGKAIINRRAEHDRRADNATPFSLKNIDIVVPRGQVVAIVGPVGSGKVPHHLAYHVCFLTRPDSQVFFKASSGR